MAGVTKNLMVRAGADFSAITDQSKKASKSMRDMESSVGKSCRGMQKAVAGFKKAFTFAAVVYAAKRVYQAATDAAEAYDQQAEAEMKLARVMRNTMGAANGEIQSILDLASAQQRLGVIGDEVQLAGAQELATYLSMSSTLQTLIPVMNDMAVQQHGYNVTAEQTTAIATMLGKVMNGQVGALSRYGYTFSAAQEQILKYGNEAQRAAVLAEVVEQSVGGMNRALAQTPTGRMKQLSNTLGDVKEQFGQAVRTIGVLFIPLLNKVADILAAVATLANRVAQSFANVFGGGQGAGSEWKYIPGGVGEIADGYDDVADGIDSAAESTEDLTKATKKAEEEAEKLRTLADFDQLHVLAFPETATDDETTTPTPGASPSTGYTPPSIQQNGMLDDGSGNETIGWLEKLLDKVKEKWNEFKEGLDLSKLKDAFTNLKDALTPIVKGIGAGLVWLWENALKPLATWTINELAPRQVDALANAFRVLYDIFKLLEPILTAIWPILKWMSEIAAFAVTTAIDQLNQVLEALHSVLSGTTDGVGFLVDALGAAGAGGLLATLASGSSIVGGFGTALTGTMVPALGAGTAAAGGAAAGAAGLLGPIAAVIAIVTALGIAIYECCKHWDEIREAAAKTWQQITKAWDGAGEWFRNSVWEPIKAWGDQSWSDAQDAAARARDHILQVWTGVDDWFHVSVWEPIRSWAAEAWDRINLTVENARDWTQRTWAGAGEWFHTSVWDPVRSRAAEAWAGIDLIVSNARGWTQRTWAGAGEWFRNSVWDPVRSRAAEAWAGIDLTVSNASDWTQRAWAGASEWFQVRVWDPVKKWAADAWEKVGEGSDKTGTDTAVKWFQVGTYLSEQMQSVRSTAEQAWQGVQTTSATAADAIKTAFSTAWDGITQIWQAAGDWFSGSVFGTIVDGAAGAVENVLGFFSDMASSVAETISSIGGWLSDLASAASDMFSGMVSFNFNIPFLADGAVIPPNRKFTAVLGDQHSGMNIETPERLLRQIMRQEIAPVRGLRGSAGDTLSEAISDGNTNGMLLGVLDEILDAVIAGHDIILDETNVGKSMRRIMREQDRIAGTARI